jgi:hypothetical protein
MSQRWVLAEYTVQGVGDFGDDLGFLLAGDAVGGDAHTDEGHGGRLGWGEVPMSSMGEVHRVLSGMAGPSREALICSATSPPIRIVPFQEYP